MRAQRRLLRRNCYGNQSLEAFKCGCLKPASVPLTTIQLPAGDAVLCFFAVSAISFNNTVLPMPLIPVKKVVLINSSPLSLIESKYNFINLDAQLIGLGFSRTLARTDCYYDLIYFFRFSCHYFSIF